MSRYVPERCLHAYGTPRPVFLVIVVALTAIINAVNAFAPLPLLALSALLAGFAFGGIWSLMSAITSDIFGLRYFASNYSLIQVRLETPSLDSLQVRGPEKFFFVFS